MLFKKVTLLFISLILTISVLAQSDKDQVILAEDFIYNENFDGAIRLYKKMLETDPDNTEINFKLGFCYLNTVFEKEKSIEYIEKSVNKHIEKKNTDNAFIESYYYLGKAYSVNYEYEKALNIFQDLKTQVPERNKDFHKQIDNQILICQEGSKLKQNPVKITIRNLGNSINSKFTDHSPVVSADDSLLIFTSRRPNETNQTEDIDGEYYEDIYYATRNGNNWTAPALLPGNVNSSTHEATIGLSADGQQLFIYKPEDDGSIYTSKLEGDKWSEPQKLNENINTKYRETHASLSADGNYLYFTSNRKGGYGNLDIYVSRKLPNGQWGPAENLGPAVNTEFEENSPFIHPDGVTLYFSSKGHGGLGGLDIFFVEKNDFGTWTRPENVGYPINTVENDLYYMLSTDGQKAYYVSNKANGFGHSDIYQITLFGAADKGVTLFKGKVRVCAGNLPETFITVTDNYTGDIIGTYTPNSKSGNFLLVLNRGNSYNISFEANGEIVYVEDLVVAEDAASQQLYKVIKLDPNVKCAEDEFNDEDFFVSDEMDPKNIDEEGNIYDTNIEIDNILFALGSASQIRSNKSLDDLAKYLNNNPEAIVEIGAYADASGKASVNRNLTKKRAQVVKNYLMARKVKSKQLVLVAYGEENPIALNKKNENWNPKGQAFNRRIEFRMIQQGQETLLIRPIGNIPEDIKNPHYKKDYQVSSTIVESEY